MMIGAPNWLQRLSSIGEVLVHEPDFARSFAVLGVAYALFALGSLFYALAAAVTWGLLSGQLYGCG